MYAQKNNQKKDTSSQFEVSPNKREKDDEIIGERKTSISFKPINF